MVGTSHKSVPEDLPLTKECPRKVLYKTGGLTEYFPQRQKRCFVWKPIWKSRTKGICGVKRLSQKSSSFFSKDLKGVSNTGVSNTGVSNNDGDGSSIKKKKTVSFYVSLNPIQSYCLVVSTKKKISQLQIIIQLLCLKKGCWNPPVIDHAISAHHGELSQFIHASSHLKSQNSFWKWCV